MQGRARKNFTESEFRKLFGDQEGNGPGRIRRGSSVGTLAPSKPSRVRAASGMAPRTKTPLAHVQSLMVLLKMHGVPECEREFRFHPVRKWRFDFAWPEKKVAIEIEGAVWTGGRHTRGAGYVKDCEKYNAAAELGWVVLRYTTTDLKKRPVQVCEQIAKVLASR